jgi:hypothetical protein
VAKKVKKPSQRGKEVAAPKSKAAKKSIAKVTKEAVDKHAAKVAFDPMETRAPKKAPVVVEEPDQTDGYDGLTDEEAQAQQNTEPPTNELVCVDCGLPIPPSDMPLVLEWGKRKDGLQHLGPPIKKAKHLDCDRLARGKAIPSRTSEQQPAPKAPKQPKEPSAPRAPRASSSEYDGKTIHRIVKGNPRKEGTHGWKSFNLVQDGMTVEDYLKAGGRKVDLAWDLDHKFVELR